jgi:endonuclease I
MRLHRLHIDNDEEGFLRKWHNQDPVDSAEMMHHETVFQTQGNRNPFIDQPDLVDQIADF